MVVLSFGTGLVGALLVLVVVQPSFSWHSLDWGIVAGLAQGVGWAAFAVALRIGRISTVAPLAAATTATLQYFYGLADGTAFRPCQGSVRSSVSRPSCC